MALVLTIIVFVLTTVILILAVLWDVRTRKRKEDKKIKEKMESVMNGSLSQDMKEMVVFGVEADDLEYVATEQAPSKKENINDLFTDLFSSERRTRNTTNIKKKGAKLKAKFKSTGKQTEMDEMHTTEDDTTRQ